MEYIIEEWKEKDLPEMLTIWNQIVEEGEAFPQEEILDTRSGKEFFSGQSFCGIIKNIQSEKIEGLYILHPNNVGRCGHICNASYAINRKMRGSGLGESLVKHSLKTAKDLGFKIMQFNAVASDNVAANKLYQKLGFIKLGTIPDGFKNRNNIYKDINLYYYIL